MPNLEVVVFGDSRSHVDFDDMVEATWHKGRALRERCKVNVLLTG